LQTSALDASFQPDVILKKNELAPFTGYLSADKNYRFYQARVGDAMSCEAKLLDTLPRPCENRVSWGAFFSGLSAGLILSIVVQDALKRPPQF
jgi:hypothetical protein